MTRSDRVATLEEAKAEFQKSWDAWKAWAKLKRSIMAINRRTLTTGPLQLDLSTPVRRYTPQVGETPGVAIHRGSCFSGEEPFVSARRSTRWQQAQTSLGPKPTSMISGLEPLDGAPAV